LSTTDSEFGGWNDVEDEKEDLNRLRFENGDVIPNVESYFKLLQ
jgi:hypothetical protein